MIAAQVKIKITYLGHACFSIEAGGSTILFDPFVSQNPLAKHIHVDELKADYILVSHGHSDHVADVESIAKRTKATVVSNFEVASWFEERGVENVWAMNHGGSRKFDFGSVKFVNAVHSSVLPDGTYGGNPGGFVLHSEHKRVYYAGDTALTMDMELIGRYETPDLAILPIGDNFTMGIRDGVRCAEMVRCNKVIGMHYDTFPPIEIDHEKAVNEFKEAGKELILLKIGESTEL